VTNQLQRTRVAFVVANEGIEQAELLQPWQAVADAGADPQLVAPAAAWSRRCAIWTAPTGSRWTR
jgi:protease I